MTFNDGVNVRAPSARRALGSLLNRVKSCDNLHTTLKLVCLSYVRLCIWCAGFPRAYKVKHSFAHTRTIFSCLNQAELMAGVGRCKFKQENQSKASE